MAKEYDLVILGAGPGGYIAAIRAAQLGLKTAVVEREELGGVCLNWGCIPSKALLRSAEVVNLFNDSEKWGVSFENLSVDLGVAIDRSRGVVDRMVKGIGALFKKNGIDLYKGEGHVGREGIVTVSSIGETLQARNVIIATGAQVKDLPSLKPDGERIITSRDALALRTPPKSIVIVGGGAVGVEFAYFFNSYGSDVTIIEMLSRLVPSEDEEVSQHLERALKAQGIKLELGCTVEKVTSMKGELRLDLSAGRKVVECEKLLMGVGVVPNSAGLGLEQLGVELDHGFLRVDDQMKTNIPGLYAIGDVTGKLALAHVASAQGVHAAEAIAGRDPAPLDYERMPRATYCQPQVASMGLSEAGASEQGYNVKVGRYPFAASAKAAALGFREGFVKIVSDGRHGEILGAHMIGHDVTDLLAEISVAQMLEGTVSEIGRMVHGHPTLSEAVMEAGLAVSGESLNT